MEKMVLFSLLAGVSFTSPTFAWDTYYNQNRQSQQSYYGEPGEDGRLKTEYVRPYERQENGQQEHVDGYYRRPSSNNPYGR